VASRLFYHVHSVITSLFLLQSKVIDLKQKILQELNIPVARQRLIFQGRVLSDDFTITEGCILIVICQVLSNVIKLLGELT